MNVNATWVFRSASVGFLALLSACVESDTGERDAQPPESSSDGGLDDGGDGPDGPNPPDLDGGDSGSWLDGGPDAGPNPLPQSDAEVDAGGCGGTGLTCSGDTPVCAAGVCVECTSEDDAQCGETERCNPATNRCDIENHPFALDCANLPSDGACQGGPREVVLAMHKEGAIAMLDPEDGHFLGYFKANHDDNADGIYYQATQGPDQCIWTVHSGRAVERWDTDGKYKDNIIPTKKHYVTDPTHGSQDVIDAPHSIAFTADRAFVASTAGTPNARVSSFELDGSFDEVVSDDGRRVHSLVALGDGSLVVASNLVTLPGSPRRVDLLPADGSAPVPLVTDATEVGQVAYANDGSIVVTDTWEGHLYRASLTGGDADKFIPVPAQDFEGVAPLRNGKWQVSGGTTGLGTVDPTSVNPVAKWERGWDDKAFARPRDYMFLGRACLPTAFVEARAPEPPVASCDAPEGTVLYSEDFESGDFTGTGEARHFNDVYELPLENVTVSIDPALGADQSARSLHILGAPADENGDLILAHEAPPSGVNVRAFASDKPAYVSYWFRVELEDAWAAHFILNSRFENVLDGVYVSSSDEDGLYLSTYHSNLIVPITENEWHQVQLRIDWDRRMYDLYVDCERVADDILFPIGGANDLDTIELRNYWPTDGSWFDEIVVK
jgi:hypothetical protein